MNATTRIKMIKEAIRLANMVQRGRGELEDQVRRNKEDIDYILAGMARHTIPRCLLRKRPRLWSDLRPQDQARIVNKLARKAIRLDIIYSLDDMVRNQLKCGIVGPLEEAFTQVSQRAKGLSGRTHRLEHSPWCLRVGKRLTKEGTPTTRLDKLRRSMIDHWRYDVALGYCNPIGKVEFYADIHPDDVEWYRHPIGEGKEDNAAYIVICSRQILKLSKLFLGYKPLAANLYLKDEATASEVYYAAFLETPRKAPPTITRAYIGVAHLPRKKKPSLTSLYKTAAGALKAANNLYGHHMASLIYKEAAQ